MRGIQGSTGNKKVQRLLNGRKVRDIARKVGLSESGLGRILRGERMTSMRRALRIARAFGVSVEALSEATHN